MPSRKKIKLNYIASCDSETGIETIWKPEFLSFHLTGRADKHLKPRVYN